MTFLADSRKVLGAMSLLAFAAFGFALFSQHVLGMAPCAWCVLQRMVCLAIGVVAGAAWLSRRQMGATLAIALVFVLSIGGMLAAWYQRTVAANLFSCDLTLADRIVTASGLDRMAPPIFGVFATCAESAVHLLGVRYEVWTLLLFGVMAAASLAALITRIRSTAIRLQPH